MGEMIYALVLTWPDLTLGYGLPPWVGVGRVERFGPHVNHWIKKRKRKMTYCLTHPYVASICLQFILFTLVMLGPGWLTFSVQRLLSSGAGFEWHSDDGRLKWAYSVVFEAWGGWKESIQIWLEDNVEMNFGCLWRRPTGDKDVT